MVDCWKRKARVVTWDFGGWEGDTRGGVSGGRRWWVRIRQRAD